MRIYHAQDSKIYQIAQLWYRNTGRKVYQGSVQAKPSYSEVWMFLAILLYYNCG